MQSKSVATELHSNVGKLFRSLYNKSWDSTQQKADAGKRIEWICVGYPRCEWQNSPGNGYRQESREPCEDINRCWGRSGCPGWGHMSCVKGLVHAGAALDVGDYHMDTAPLWAAYNGRYDTLQMLMDAGAALDIRGHDECSALSQGTDNEFVNATQLLLRGQQLWTFRTMQRGHFMPDA